MASKPITIPPYRAETPLLGENSRITPDAHRSLLQLYGANPLITVSTAGGPTSIPLPLAKANQGVEITYIKISPDGSIATLTASGTDLINGGSTLAMGAAPYSRIKIKSDGVSNWYVVS